MLSCYVAGRVAQADLGVSDVLELLDGHGFAPTYDWTVDDSCRKPYLDHVATNAPSAQSMIDGAAAADLFVLLWDDNLFGALLEAGAAMASGVPTLVVGWPHDGRQTVFFALDNVVLLDDLDALDRWLADADVAPALGRDPLTGHARWAVDAIPQTPAEVLTKFSGEVAEFLDEPSTEEAADIALVLAYWAHLRGESLVDAARDKAVVNRARTWRRKPDGTFQHVPVADRDVA